MIILRWVSVFLALAACTPTPTRVLIPEDGLRPGVGADFAFDTVRPRIGQRVIYRYSDGFTPFEVRENWRIARAEGGLFRLTGQRETIIEGIDLEDAVADFRANFGDAPVKVAGDRLVEPLSATVDRRMRATQVAGPVQSSRFAPHDCFATLGTCRYTRTGPVGETQYVISETTEADGIWRETRYTDPERDPSGRKRLLGETAYTMDSQALVIDAKFVNYVGPRPAFSTLTRLR